MTTSTYLFDVVETARQAEIELQYELWLLECEDFNVETFSAINAFVKE